MPMELAAIINNTLRYNATCESCGESFLITDSKHALVEPGRRQNCPACNGGGTVFAHELTTILIKNGIGTLV